VIHLLRTSALLLILPLASCGWWSDPLGHFEGTFSGDESFAAEWEATFGLDYILLSGEQGFVRFEPMPDVAGRYALGPQRVGRLPAPGDSLFAEAAFRLLTVESVYYGSTGGFLVFESATDTEVRGSVVMDAVSTREEGRSFRLEGTFVAEYAEPSY